MVNVALNWDFQSIEEKKIKPKYQNTASPTEGCSGRGTLITNSCQENTTGFICLQTLEPTGTSCGYTSGVPRDSIRPPDTWGGKTAPRDILSSQQKLSLDFLQLLLTLPKEDSIKNLPQRKQSRAGITNFRPHLCACGLFPKPPRHTNIPCAPNDKNPRNSSDK